MLAHKIMRTGYFWLTMETDCCQFVQRCIECYSTIRVACINLTLAIFSLEHRCYWEDFAEVF